MSLTGRHNGPEAMTRRARWYLCIGAVRHALIAVFTLGWGNQFTNMVFVPLVTYAPLVLWGSAMLAATVTMTLAAFLRSAAIARVGLIISAVVTLTLGTAITLGVVLAWLTPGVQATPLTAILLLSLAAKDFAVCTQPMKSPFEDLMNTRAIGRALGAR